MSRAFAFLNFGRSTKAILNLFQFSAADITRSIFILATGKHDTFHMASLYVQLVIHILQRAALAYSRPFPAVTDMQNKNRKPTVNAIHCQKPYRNRPSG
jgi:hypothetical protein